MHDTNHHHINPPQHRMLTDPMQLAAFIEAWEVARIAYGEVLERGVQRPDTELARDEAYRRLLQAGLQIHRLAGTEAIGVVSASLGRFHRQGGAGHFQRLWCGLMPTKVH